jgi:hypothetical protein
LETGDAAPNDAAPRLNAAAGKAPIHWAAVGLPNLYFQFPRSMIKPGETGNPLLPLGPTVIKSGIKFGHFALSEPLKVPGGSALRQRAQRRRLTNSAVAS